MALMIPDAAGIYTELEPPRVWNPAMEAYQDTTGRVWNAAQEVWQDVWPDRKTVYYIRDGVPQMDYTWEDALTLYGGSVSGYSAQTSAHRFVLSVSGTASAGKNIMFPAVDYAGVLYMDGVSVSADHGNNTVHGGISEGYGNGKHFAYGLDGGGASRSAYALASGKTGASMEQLFCTLAAGAVPRIGIYCNNVNEYRGELKFKDLYFVYD